MLKPAQLYKEELIKKGIETWYDMNYQWYHGGGGSREFIIPDNSYESRCFASVDKDNNVIGYLAYSISQDSQSAYNFGAISFDRGNPTMAMDMRQLIADIFFKYNMNRVDWCCFADNPAIKGYRSFIKRYGGRECGYFRQQNRLMDGKLHDSVCFEILREDLLVAPVMKDNQLVFWGARLAYDTSYRDLDQLEVLARWKKEFKEQRKGGKNPWANRQLS